MKSRSTRRGFHFMTCRVTRARTPTLHNSVALFLLGALFLGRFLRRSLLSSLLCWFLFGRGLTCPASSSPRGSRRNRNHFLYFDDRRLPDLGHAGFFFLFLFFLKDLFRRFAVSAAIAV